MGIGETLDNSVHLIGIKQEKYNARTKMIISSTSTGLAEEFVITKSLATLKQDICRSILSSQFFKMKQNEYIDSENEEIRTELQRDYSVIFDSIYRRLESRISVPGLLNGIYSYVYENVHRVRKIRIGDNDEDEFTFTCLARDNTDSGRIKEYFVTRQYNVNLVSDASPIFGRFVAKRNSSNVLEVLALAEEAATGSGFVRKTKLAEAVYAGMLASSGYPSSKILSPTIVFL